MDKKKFIELYAQGYSDKDLVKVFMVSATTIWRTRKLLGLPKNHINGRICISNRQKELLIGTLIGDTSIGLAHSGVKYPRLSFSHCIAQKDYFMWKYKILENLLTSKNPFTQKLLGVSYDNIRAIGKTLPVLVEFNVSKTTLLSLSMLEKYFTTISLAALYMDDGGYDRSNDSYHIFTNSFDKTTLDIFVGFLYRKFGIQFSVVKHKKIYLSLYLQAKYKPLFLNLIKTYLIDANLLVKSSLNSVNCLGSLEEGNQQPILVEI